MIEDDWVDLADAVRVVREQLDIAREAGEAEGTRFEVTSVEVELAVQVTKDVTAKGGLRLGCCRWRPVVAVHRRARTG